MNISASPNPNPFKKNQEKIQELQRQMDIALDVADIAELEEELWSDGYQPGDGHEFLQQQEVSTHKDNLNAWKTVTRVALGAAGGAALGYQGGKVGAYGNAALATAGMACASVDGPPDLGEVLGGGLISVATVSLLGSMGGWIGAATGAFTGGLLGGFSTLPFPNRV